MTIKKSLTFLLAAFCVMAAGSARAQLNWDGSAASNGAALQKTLAKIAARGRTLGAHGRQSDPSANPQYTSWYSFDNYEAVPKGCPVTRISGTPVSSTLIKGDLKLYPVHDGPPNLYAKLVVADNGVGPVEWRNDPSTIPPVLLKVGIGRDPSHIAQTFAYAMPRLRFEPFNGDEVYQGGTPVARYWNGELELLPGHSLQFRVKYVSSIMPLGGDDYAGVVDGYLEAALVSGNPWCR
ncbi:MAG: hypothetical protein KGL04_06985 [Elusimicrobia bacterium]|nr:hypothetical protein [Elusimicrobiota bacterium]MDE2313900.1 hypothetical protein [Elusimicrobiota bacterium]